MKHSLLLFAVLCVSAGCKPPSPIAPTHKVEKISYFKFQQGKQSAEPYKYRFTYFFDNGLPHRWLELDSLGKVQIDYIYAYDEQFNMTQASYREPGEEDYSIERFVPNQDSSQVTVEWLDSAGNVYYKMVEELNASGQVYKAAFIGDKLHGYDTTYYNEYDLPSRIYFTNTQGKILNDRSFEYDSINPEGAWIARRLLRADTIQEVQKKALGWKAVFNTASPKFYEGVISTAELGENVMSMNRNEDLLFFTAGNDWINQQGYLAQKQGGIFTLPQQISFAESLYNGALSPAGDQILYCVRGEEKTEIFLSKRKFDAWSEPINLSATSGLYGGYFSWLTEDEIYFYQNKNGGDIYKARLTEKELVDVEAIAEINTPANEFSPFIDPAENFIIFTRYDEHDPEQRGFFISRKQDQQTKGKWSTAEKIRALSYGWGAFISRDKETFFYTNGEDILSLPTAHLGISLD